MDKGHCLVTGANRGLGLEFVRQLLARGERVVATCRHPGRATALNALATIMLAISLVFIVIYLTAVMREEKR